MNERTIFALSVVWLALSVLICLQSCIPVYLRAEKSDKGEIVPVVVTVEPRHDAVGREIPLAVAQTQPPPEQRLQKFAPVDAKPADLPVPQTTDYGSILTWILGILAGGGGGWAILASRAVSGLRTALTVAAQHADRMEKAETQQDVDSAKDDTIEQAERMGVTDIIAKARGKPTKKQRRARS